MILGQLIFLSAYYVWNIINFKLPEFIYKWNDPVRFGIQTY